MLPGFCWKQSISSHNTKEIEEQEQATPEASTIDTISTLDNSNSGKTFKTSNDIESVTENNAFLGNVHYTSDISNFCANVSTQNNTHSSDIFPMYTETMFPNPCTCNEMLSHYNYILIGCFMDIFQTVDTKNLSAVLQALKEHLQNLNAVLTGLK